MNIVAASLAALTVLAAQQPSEIGRSIYHEATGVSVWLNRGEFKTSGGSFACAGCHGSAGQGAAEAGISAPPIHSAALNQASAARPAYDAGLLHRAVANGVDPAGRHLAPTMPLYELTADQWRSLKAYLDILGTPAAFARGVTDSEIRIGVALPLSGSLAPAGRELESRLRKEFESVAAIFGRRFQLAVADSASGGLTRALDLLTGERQVFTIVAAYAAQPGAIGELTRWTEARGELAVAPVTFDSLPPVSLVFPILPSLEDQTAVLADWAVESFAADIWAIDAPPDSPLAAVFAARLSAKGVPISRDLSKCSRVAYFGDTAGLERLLRKAPAGMPIATLSIMAGRVPLAAGIDPNRFQLVAPLAGGFAEFSRTAARVVAEACRRAGRRLDRAGLTSALESLDLPGEPPVHFSRTDRRGVRGAYRLARTSEYRNPQ